MREIIAIVRNSRLMEMGADEIQALKNGRERQLRSGSSAIYVSSIYKVDSTLFCVGRNATGKFMYQLSTDRLRSRFAGETGYMQRLYCQEIPMVQRNMRALWKAFPWTQPVSLRDRRTTIGMGDRLGLATPGQLRSVRKFDAAPVLAQQSVRELDFTGRTFEDVVADASFLVFQEGYEKGYGADGDHLKNIAAIRRAVRAGMPMITLDLTEVMKPEVAGWDQRQVHQAFQKVRRDAQVRIRREYAGKSFRVGRNSISCPMEETERMAVMYLPAIEFAQKVDKYLRRARKEGYDLEISIDETTTPTIPVHHLFIARELQHRGVQFTSIAPRFVGEFQKAVDYIGNVREFDREFAIHCDIARETVGYKVSVHSGSDKFGVYPSIGRHTEGRFHLKTSGTSWLEALRVVARTNPDLYRRIHQKALEVFPEASKQYHVTVDLEKIVPLDRVRERQLVDYLKDGNTRQMLHISYGGILTDAELRKELYAELHKGEEEYATDLVHHFDQHLELLGVPEAEA